MLVDPKILSLKEYIQLVEIKLNSSDFKIVCLQEKGMEDRRGFLGDHFHIKINVQKPLSSNHETKTESIYFFIKSLPINERARKLVEELGCFQKERFFYEVLSKDFYEFLKSNETDCFKLYPSCLMVKEDMFILDNLREDGFIPVESIQSTVDIPHCEQVLSGLAKFHSASILKEHFSKKSLKQLYPEILYENIYVDKGMWAKWMDAGVRTLQDLVPHLPRYKNDPMLLQKIEKKFQQLKHVMIELLKPTTTARSVICHGDSWISNFLFKYENNKPQEVALIDFQSLRYGPPAMDVQLFLYLSLPHDEEKSKQMSILEDFYYDCLKKELATKNLDVDSILPQTEFKETCETYALLGAFSICMYYQMMMVDNSFIDKVMTNRDMYDKYVLTSRSEEITGFFETDERFRKAMNGGMELLIELLLGN